MKTDVSPGAVLGTQMLVKWDMGCAAREQRPADEPPAILCPLPPKCDSSKSSAPNSPLPSTTPSCDRFWSQSKPLIFIHILQEVWELRKWPRFRLLGQEVRHLQPWQLLFIISAMYALNQNANVVKLIFTCNSKCPDTICRDLEQVKRINL